MKTRNPTGTSTEVRLGIDFNVQLWQLVCAEERQTRGAASLSASQLWRLRAERTMARVVALLAKHLRQGRGASLHGSCGARIYECMQNEKDTRVS